MVASSSTCCAEGVEKGTEAASCWQGKQKTRGQPERRHRDYSVQEGILEEVERVMVENALTRQDAFEVVSDKTGVPVSNMTRCDSQVLNFNDEDKRS